MANAWARSDEGQSASRRAQRAGSVSPGAHRHGYGQQKDRLRAADAGFDCHFVKPVSVRDLMLILDQRVVSTVRPLPAA